jgi:large conductance mechanosensitive channel
MGMMKEFKDFAMRGNVVDMAVGIVIGGAFGKIVSSLVQDVILPPIGLLLGDVNFTELKITLKEAKEAVMEGDAVVTEAVEAVTINYGTFVATILDFIIVAFVIFQIVRAMNKMKKKKEEAPAAPPKPSKEEALLTEIRDLLKK